MITSDPAHLLAALGAGLLAGGVFFAGLWWTVRRLPVARHPAVLFALSFVARTAVVLGAFFLAGRGHFDRMMFCLAGFLIARSVVLRLTGGSSPRHPKPRKEASGAPQP